MEAGDVVNDEGELEVAASMLTNPAFLIIAWIVLLVAAFVLAYNKFWRRSGGSLMPRSTV